MAEFDFRQLANRLGLRTCRSLDSFYYLMFFHICVDVQCFRLQIVPGRVDGDELTKW